MRAGGLLRLGADEAASSRPMAAHLAGTELQVQKFSDVNHVAWSSSHAVPFHGDIELFRPKCYLGTLL